MAPEKADIPDHVNDTIIAMSHLHAEHDRRTHRVVRVITAAIRVSRWRGVAGGALSRRDQLSLQLALLNDQKSATIIRLLEELRYNDPHQGNELDAEAEAMAMPADPCAVLAKISATNAVMRDDE
jgi:hypothetical protein